MTERREWFYLVNAKGEPLLNILEVSEGWCWAILWQRQSKKNEFDAPSQVPPDWIKGLKEACGYRCEKLRATND